MLAYDSPPADAPPTVTTFVRQHLPAVTIGILVTLLIVFALYPYMLITVPSGEAGVLWKRFTGPGIYCWCINPSGTVLNPDETRKEGLHFIWPWDRIFLYDLRVQSSTEKYNAISSDGVSVTAEINLQYRVSFESAALLHEFVGPDYLTKLLAPQVRSQTRLVISKYTAEQVYLNSTRQVIETEIKSAITASLRATLDGLFQASASNQDNPEQYRTLMQGAVGILNTLVLSIELPAEIVSAINAKTQQYYKIREYEFRVLTEAQEAKRKQIEADGIAAFQRTVGQGISESYLRWQGIQATLSLAQSSNSKIVIVGNKDGLPLILGNLDSPASSQPPASAPNQNPNPTSSTSTPPTSPPNQNPNPPPSTSTPPSSAPNQNPNSNPSSPTPPKTSGPTPPEKAPGPESPSTVSSTLSQIQALLSRLTGSEKDPTATPPSTK